MKIYKNLFSFFTLVIIGTTLAAFAYIPAAHSDDDDDDYVPSLSKSAALALPLVVKGESVTSHYRGLAVRDFGTVDPETTPHLAQDFTLSNPASTAVRVVDLDESCTCMTTTVICEGGLKMNAEAVSSTVPLVIPGGKTVKIHVDVDLAMEAINGGTFVKSVTLQTLKGKATLPIILMMHFNVPPQVEFKPVLLNFSTLTPVSSRTLSVIVHIKRGLLKNGQIKPMLVSSNPSFTVAPGSVVGTAGNAYMDQNYVITAASTAPIGPITGELYFMPYTLGGKAAPPSTTYAAWSSVRALLSGTVIGDARAEPSTVSFGIATAAVGNTKSVDLVGTKEALSTLKADAVDAPWLTIKTGDMEQVGTTADTSHSAQFHRPLIVSIVPSAPSGTLRGLITVALGNGQTLNIPASAYIPKSIGSEAKRTDDRNESTRKSQSYQLLLTLICMHSIF